MNDPGGGDGTGGTDSTHYQINNQQIKQINNFNQFIISFQYKRQQNPMRGNFNGSILFPYSMRMMDRITCMH